MWIRYTVHKRPGREPTGSLWFTLFDAGAGGPGAAKEHGARAGARASASGSGWGRPRIGPGAGVRRAAGIAWWELRSSRAEEPLFHLPRDWMYRAPLPQHQAAAARLPDARFGGWLGVEERQIALDGWRGMVGPQLGRRARRALDLAARR